MSKSTELNAAKRDWAAAARALRDMRDARSLEETESAWRAFLNAINRVWTKAELACRKSPGFPSWWSARASARRKDPLLRYLHHARNSDEHTLTEIVSRQPGSFSIKPAPGVTSGYIDSLEVQGNGNQIDVRYSGTPVEFEVRQPRVQLEAAFDRGRWYNPPKAHLGQPIGSTDPVSIAALGLDYCRAMLDDAEERFFGSSA